MYDVMTNYGCTDENRASGTEHIVGNLYIVYRTS